MSGFWTNRKYHLDKMTLGELVAIFFQYPAIQTYLALAAVSTVLTLAWVEAPWPPVVAAAVTFAIYPLVWYLLHRFVLHGRYLYRSPWTARLWKRVHFDHHRDPNDLRVLFGALHTTLPTIFLIVTPIGWAIGGAPAAAAAIAMGMLTVCFYEFCHCVQHLAYTPKSPFLRRIKKLHLAHHFHNEAGNYGITDFSVDRVLGTYYADPRAMPRSTTVFNLGYTGEEIRRYPWVARLTEDLDEETSTLEGRSARRRPSPS